MTVRFSDAFAICIRIAIQTSFSRQFDLPNLSPLLKLNLNSNAITMLGSPFRQIHANAVKSAPGLRLLIARRYKLSGPGVVTRL